jgi:hypothetical protein
MKANQINIKKASNRNTQLYEVRIGQVSLFFSYETCIAFQYPKGAYMSENVWSVTTGRHMNELGKTWFTIIPYKEFQRKLEELELNDWVI